MTDYKVFPGDVSSPNDVELVPYPHTSTAGTSSPPMIEPQNAMEDNSRIGVKTSSGMTQMSQDPIDWDESVADQLMYKATPILLIVCSALLSLTMGTITPPTRTAVCFVPKEFTVNQRLYGEKECSSANATIYTQLIDQNPTIPPGGLQPGSRSQYFRHEVSEFFPIESYQNPPVISTLIIMVVLCMVPWLLWRNVGIREITYYISVTKHKGSTSSTSTTTSLYLYLATKVMNVVLCAIFILLVQLVVMKNTTSYVSAYKYYRTPKSIPLICDYWEVGTSSIRRTLLCMISANEDVRSHLSASFDLHTVPHQLALALRIWIIILLIAQVFNCAFVVGMYLASLSKWYRMAFMECFPCGYAGRERTSEENETMDQTLGASGVFIVMLAVRNGYSQHLSVLLNALAVRIQLIASKSQ